MFGLSSKKTSCGLQILDRQAKIVSASGSSRARIAKQQSVPLSEGIVRDGKIIDEEALVRNLSIAVDRLSIREASATLVIPTSSIILRKANLPSVKNKELRNLIDVELNSGDAKLPFKNPIFDFIPIREENGHKEVLIFASAAEVVEQYVDIARRSGLQPVAVDAAPLALFRLLLRCYKAEGQALPQRFVLLDAESDRAEISIFVNGYPFFFRAVTISSHQLIDEDADRMEAYGRQMSTEMGRVMNYYKYSVATAADEEEVGELILIGDAALTEGLSKAVESDFKKVTSLPMDRAVTNYDPQMKSFAVPIGLAMKGA
ncbi:type IV pilus biogenesis protein PilM [Paenibacillaceae bacterium WGS1546]|uniref:type IV pilus biogenesis protein PilM n=1 Tax=Cohnella sp. WGS1546 TaxID=3366810 RepID=UPI00372D3180